MLPSTTNCQMGTFYHGKFTLPKTSYYTNHQKVEKIGTKLIISKVLTLTLTALSNSLQQITQNIFIPFIYVMCNKNYRWHKAVCKGSRQSKNQSHK